MIHASDDDWDEFFYGLKTLLEVREQKKTVGASALGIKNWWRTFSTVHSHFWWIITEEAKQWIKLVMFFGA